MVITENVFQLDSTKRSHAFLVRAGGLFLVDTGMPGLAEQILEEIRQLGVSPNEIRAILLTHHDVDHSGNAEYLRQATGAELWAPEADVSFLVGKEKRPGVKHLIETFVRPQKPTVTGTYGADWPYRSIRVLPAPGHTPGHTIFQASNVVLAGDLFQYRNGRFGLLPNRMNWNRQETKKSLLVLSRLEFEWVCPAHGDPVRNGPALRNFLARCTLSKP